VRRLVRFGYDGRSFGGWARQPGLRTVEGTLREGLLRLGLVTSPDLLRLEVSSRTDRGVSARANALTLDVDLALAPLLRALNGIAPDIFFTAATTVPSSFRVRDARRRVYRYFEPSFGPDADRWSRMARWFEGELDVRSFGHGIRWDVPHHRTVEAVRVLRRGTGLVIEVVGTSFVWHQVRKMIGALRAVEMGDLPESSLRAAVRGELRITPPLAEAEHLLLWEVEVPVAWEVFWRGPNRRQRAHFAHARALAWSRLELLSELSATLEGE